MKRWHARGSQRAEVADFSKKGPKIGNVNASSRLGLEARPSAVSPFGFQTFKASEADMPYEGVGEVRACFDLD